MSVLVDIIININKWLSCNISHEGLIAIPALFVALLIPIAFFLMERHDLYGFDKNVILEKIILAKISVPLVFITSIALLFNVSLLSAILVTLMLIMITVVLIRVYRWTASIELLQYTNTYKQEMRLSFIRNIKRDAEKVDTWAIILSDKKLLEKNQRGLISEFLVAVKNLHDSDQLYPKTNLIRLMSRNIHKIDFSDIQSYENLVNYSIRFFSEKWTIRERRKLGEIKAKYPPYSQKELAVNLLKIALDKKNNDIFGYIYFSTIKKYLEENSNNEAGFIRDFLPAYMQVIKDNEEYEAGELWQELSDWIITKDLFSREETRAKTLSLFNAYIDSFGNEIHLGLKLSRHQASVVDNITSNLFPGIDAAFWFDIAIFYTSSYGLDEGEDSTHAQIRHYVKDKREFGLSSGVTFGYWIEDEDERMESYLSEFKKRDEETIYMLGLRFVWLYNPVETQKVLNQIEIIENEELYDAESYEAMRLESLKHHFEQIQSYTAEEVAAQSIKTDAKIQST